MNNSQSYRSFNAASFTGRVASIEIPQGRDFVSVSVITTLEDDRDVTLTFTNSAGIKSLFVNNHLTVGRQVTVTGHISDVAQVYTDSDGVVRMLKRPRLNLTAVSLELGAKPAERQAAPAAGTAVAVDKTPAMAAPAKKPEIVDFNGKKVGDF